MPFEGSSRYSSMVLLTRNVRSYEIFPSLTMHGISYSRFNEFWGSVLAMCTVILDELFDPLDTPCTHTEG